MLEGDQPGVHSTRAGYWVITPYRTGCQTYGWDLAFFSSITDRYQHHLAPVALSLFVCVRRAGRGKKSVETG